MTRRRAIAGTPETINPVATGDGLRCDWRIGEILVSGTLLGGDRRRCFLVAPGAKAGQRFCDWHVFCLTRKVPDIWEEFTRFYGAAEPYCCELSHWPIDLVWKAAQGIEDLRLRDRRPCGLPWCRHRLDVGPVQEVPF